PAKYRRHPVHPHGGPPGQMKKRGVHRDNDRDGRRYDDRDRREGDGRYRDDDRSRGNGKGKKDR
ncbi:MAG: hypothetical protein ABIP29_11390, partial [Candidatus Eisenbacteria bacterium]